MYMRLNSTDHIIQAANRLVRKFGTRDPEKIASALGIRIYDVPLKKQKGMYKVIKRNRCIFVKNDLPDVMRRIVILHEIGHDQLHRSKAKVFQEFSLFDMSGSIMEYEANLFAAQVMLPDDDILEYIYDGYSAGQIAGVLESDINLVSMKVADLSRRGHAFRTPEFKTNFLK